MKYHGNRNEDEKDVVLKEWTERGRRRSYVDSIS